MDKADILRMIAPCSLCCHTCPAMKGGEIAQSSARLRRYMDGYYEFCKAVFPPEYQEHAEETRRFCERLERMSKAGCPGCRSGAQPGCCIQGCFIPECTRERGVDFCAECPEFPCEKVNEDVFLPKVIDEWRGGNERIREAGIEQYCREAIDRSHYEPFLHD